MKRLTYFPNFRLLFKSFNYLLRCKCVDDESGDDENIFFCKMKSGNCLSLHRSLNDLSRFMSMLLKAWCCPMCVTEAGRCYKI